MSTVTLRNEASPIEVRNIFCIGRNYAAHAAELGNSLEDRPLVFLKPSSALLTAPAPIRLPTFSADVHYETELVLLIGRGGKNIPENQAISHIAGYGVGLDLTARDIQSLAKAKGLPWALAKGFDGAACVSEFVPTEQLASPNQIQFSMWLNDELRQQGDARMQLFPIAYLIHYLSSVFTLQAGDLVFTGTPEGVGKLNIGDRVKLDLAGILQAVFEVA